MSDHEELIPRPPVVRERLAKTRREAARLRRLLRLSEAAARERHEETRRADAGEPEGREGDR